MKRAFGILIAVLATLLGCGPEATTGARAPILNKGGQEQATITLTGEKGQHFSRTINAAARHHYTVCVAPEKGDADLYASFNGITKVSKNHGEWQGQGLPMRDCVTFEVLHAGVINIKVVGSQNFTAKLYFSSTPYDNVPPGFKHALIPPLDKHQLTFEKFGPFGSPWGNWVAKFNPFEDKNHDGFMHSGTDLAAPACTPVKAACSGKIVRSNMLDDLVPSEYGGYLVEECRRGNETLAIGYDHVFPNPVRDDTKLSASKQETIQNVCHIELPQLAVGDEVQQGQVIGYVYKMLAEGELDHLHFTICRGTYAECSQKVGYLFGDPDRSIHYSPQRGSMYYEFFPGRVSASGRWIGWIESDWKKNVDLFLQ